MLSVLWVAAPLLVMVVMGAMEWGGVMVSSIWVQYYYTSFLFISCKNYINVPDPNSPMGIGVSLTEKNITPTRTKHPT
jgi:hypothetical protein